ncbi:MAG: phosphatidate cytidylyltransferase [Mucilaginibacter polytrichastri]|nr:phosphatidate cytidylyltransferase [Mucilaginibacter polytrichastri]
MKTRTITGIIFVIVMLGSILAGYYVFSLFYVLLSLLCLSEFYGLVRSSGIRPHRTLGFLTGSLIFLSCIAYLFFQFPIKYLLLNIPVLCAVFIAELYKRSEVPFVNIGFTFIGVLYIIVPFCFFHGLGFLFGGYNLIVPLGFLLLLWGNDTGAYLFGMKFGRRRLFERHSPKKTWEGFFGGMATSLAVAYILSYYHHELVLIQWLIMSLIVVCFGTLGDLVESMFKRSIDAKDSGKLLPGHGGVLDRFDGLFLSAPVVFVYLYLVLH